MAGSPSSIVMSGFGNETFDGSLVLIVTGGFHIAEPIVVSQVYQFIDYTASDTSLTCPQRYEVSPTEVNGIAIDCRKKLQQGEVCTGTPTITVADITTTAPGVSSTIMLINGETVEAGKAITFTFAGGSDGEDYNIQVSFSTSAGRTREVYCLVRVRIPTASNP